MASQIPRKLTHFNLFVDGKGFAGLCSKITNPKLSMKTEDHQGGGMDMPVPVEMGMEGMEASFTLQEYDADVFKLFGFRPEGRINLIARGSLKRDGESIPLQVTYRGVISEIDMGDWSAGENTELNFTVKCEFYRLDRDGETLVEIDALNTIRKIGGVDQLAGVRRDLLL
jgi:P2 family phage contractile tail tube protein